MMDDQITLKGKVLRKDGEWLMRLELPRWLLNELEDSNIRITSSHIVGGSDSFATASITLGFRKRESKVETEGPQL